MLSFNKKFLFGRTLNIRIGEKSYKFGIVRDKYEKDPNWCWYKLKKRPRSSHEHISPINPIPSWKYRFRRWQDKAWMKLHDKLYMQCQGCGDGISEWKIRDPNGGSGNKYLNCCINCVNFYDARWSRMKIVDWKDGKAIAKKKW